MNEVTDVILDEATLLARVDHDRELLQDLIEIFLEDYPKQLDALREGIAAGEAAAVERQAHTIKGVVGNLSGNRAFEVARELEEIGRNGNLDRAQEAWRELETRLAELDSALRSMTG